MVKTIAVTKKSFDYPIEAKGLKDPYEALGTSIVGYDSYPELKKIVNADTCLAEKILEFGPKEGSHVFGYAASLLARKINEPLELLLNNTTPDHLGTLFRDGTIIVRGNLGIGAGPSFGGIMFVDGNVKSVAQDAGILYINGDVEELSSCYHNGVLIVAGEIKKVTNHGFFNSSTPVKPSPFIFTSHPIELKGYIGDKPGNVVPIQKSMVLTKNELALTPENLESKAIELCNRKILEELNNKMRYLSSLKSVDALSKFYNVHIDGLDSGYGRGYHTGVIDSLPNED
jgi:hypothetical protein